MLKQIRSDTKYPSVSKAFVDYIDDCVKFAENNTYKLETVQRYMDSILNVTPYETPNYLEALLKVVFPVPEAPGYGVFSPTKLINIYHSNRNAWSIYAADLPLQYANGKDFNEELEWRRYQLITILKKGRSEYEKLATEEHKFFEFVAEFKSIVAESNSSSRVAKYLQDINNKALQQAIVNTLPNYVDEKVNLTSLIVFLDERLFDNLHQLFLSRPQEGKNFIMYVALSMVAFSIDITPNDKEKVMEKKIIDEAPVQCFSDALDPKKSGALFNLYVANLLVRNNAAMTTVDEKLSVRAIIETIWLQIKSSLANASWLKHDRQVDIILDISRAVSVGLPEEVYNETQLSAEFRHFSGFLKDDDMIQKILRLRSSNTRLVEKPRNLGSSQSYFDLSTEYDVRKRESKLSHLLLLPPFYKKNYPDSYNYGFIGSNIGRELFHQFSPPYMPSNFLKYAAFNNTLSCYENFYNGICYYLRKEEKDGENKLIEFCANGRNRLTSNLRDVEGARVAFQVS
jgi:hypothetical protein